MNVLITGMGGFIGSHLADTLLEHEHSITGTIFSRNNNIEHIKDRVRAVQCDICMQDRVENLVADAQPDMVFHMAAQSFVIPSWKDPETTFRTNIFGTYHLLESLRKCNLNPVIVIASSSATYGLTKSHEIPTKETKEFRPSSPYAVSKVATDGLAHLYAQTYGMKIIRARFFNITGPRKTNDALADFSSQIARAELGQQSSIKIGNIDAIRDYTDVRDALRGILLLTEKGTWGEAYNICSGNGYKIADLLETLLSLSSTKLTIEQSPSMKRPFDDPIFIGDNSKLASLGWQRTINIEKTLEDILNWWRANLK